MDFEDYIREFRKKQFGYQEVKTIDEETETEVLPGNSDNEQKEIKEDD